MNQDPDLVPVHTSMTEVQKERRFKELHRAGYIMRSGVIVGWEKPAPQCKRGKCKNTVIKRTETGEGWRKRVYKVYECVVCLTRTTN